MVSLNIEGAFDGTCSNSYCYIVEASVQWSCRHHKGTKYIKQLKTTGIPVQFGEKSQDTKRVPAGWSSGTEAVETGGPWAPHENDCTGN